MPVITADYGGMAEYVGHEENGLLFAHRDPDSLARQMQRLAADTELARRLGRRGYLQSADGDVPDMREYARAVAAGHSRRAGRGERGSGGCAGGIH